MRSTIDRPLQFPKHHKRRRRKSSISKKTIQHPSFDKLTHDNIEKAIDKAYADAYALLAIVGVSGALEKKKKGTMNQVSSLIRNELEKKFKKVAFEGDEIYLSDDDEEELSYAHRSDSSLLSSSEEKDSSEEEDDASSLSANGKSQFHGMTVFDSVSSASARLSCQPTD